MVTAGRAAALGGRSFRLSSVLVCVATAGVERRGSGSRRKRRSRGQVPVSESAIARRTGAKKPPQNGACGDCPGRPDSCYAVGGSPHVT